MSLQPFVKPSRGLGVVEPAGKAWGAIREEPFVDAVAVPVHQGEFTGLESAEPAVLRFVRSFQILLRSSRLYQKNHPRLMENLETAERNLRAALEILGPFSIGIERNRIIVPRLGENPLADYRNEISLLAEELVRAGIHSLGFSLQTHLGELDTLAQLVNASLLRSEARSAAGAGPAASLRTQSWPKKLAENHIAGIDVNGHMDRKVDSVLASLVAALVAYGGTSQREALENPHAPVRVPSLDELAPALRLLARLTPPLDAARGMSPQEAAQAIHAILAETGRETVRLLVGAITRVPPRDGELPQPYLMRLSETLIFEFLNDEFVAGRLPAPEVSPLFGRLGDDLVAAGGYTGPHSSQHLSSLAAQWATETYRENLIERFWMELPPREKSAVLRSREVWCIPIAALRQTLEQLADAGLDAPRREARLVLLNYAHCLENADATPRRAVTAGLSELEPAIRTLWPNQLPEELSRGVLRALSTESVPEIAALLAALTESLAHISLARGDYAAFEFILNALEQAPEDTEHAHLTALASRLVAQDRWLTLADAALANRPLDPVLPRLLQRDPERLLDRLTLLLTDPEGLEALPAMARLLRAIGVPVFCLLETRLFEARRQRATAAVKLLAAADPEHLVRALPRALASWDWSLQDLAVSELSRPANQASPTTVAFAFSAVLADAHPMVVPMMIDQIGMAQELTAVPQLIEIAAGEHDVLRDLFARIKAIEALGRMRAVEAVDILRSIIEQRDGLAHAEPAGLRAAAEEALALIENRPSSARVRAAYEALEKASGAFFVPRRYMRVPLSSPLTAQIEGAQPAYARVRTISMGGAYLQSDRKLAVGDSMKLEIRSGLRRIHSTAVVRNVGPDGGGIEFVHMKEEDREKLRRLVQRHLHQ